MSINYGAEVSEERRGQAMVKTLELLRKHSNGLPAKTMMEKLQEDGFNPAEVRSSNLQLVSEQKVTLDPKRHFHIV